MSGAEDANEAPGGPLVVRSGALVATDGMLAGLDRLGGLAIELTDDLGRIAAAGASARTAAVDELSRLIVEARRGALELELRLERAIGDYAELEDRQIARSHQLAAHAAGALGAGLRAAALSGFLPVPFLLLAVLGSARTVSRLPDTSAADVQRWLLAHPELVTSPRFVAAVRLLATSLDDGLRGLGGRFPRLGDGVTGAEQTATGVAAVGGLVGLFRETPVRVDRVATVTIDRGAAGVAERLARVPEGDQVRIERHEAPGALPRFVVYVGPTETFSPLAQDEPWDLTSNVTGVAGQSAGSFRATELAMRDAGITSIDEVQFVGFSQGGLVAALLAASGDWNAVGLETHGAPTGNIAVPDDLAGMAVRHTDDFVPALAGPQLDVPLLQVEREAFADGRPMPTHHAAPAHQRDAYAETAELIDGAESFAIREQVRAMDAFTADYDTLEGATITVMTYHGERIPPPVEGAAAKDDEARERVSAPRG